MTQQSDPNSGFWNLVALLETKHDNFNNLNKTVNTW